MLPVALSFAVLNRGSGAGQVGFVLGAQSGGFVIFLLVREVAADRVSRRVTVVASDVLRAIAEFSLSGVLLIGHPALPVVCGVGLVVGAATAFFAPSVTGLIPQLASSSRLQQANSLNAVTMWTGNLLGPAIARVIVLSTNAGWAIVADGLTCLASALCMSRRRVGRVRSDHETTFLREPRLGWSDFRARTWL